MSLAWTKQSRIRKSREFRVVQKYGQKWKSTDFLFIFLGSKRQQSQPRVGLIASKKVGNAVVRNMVKRRLREACRKKILTIEAINIPISPINKKEPQPERSFFVV